jgi:hypothetical protein
VVGSDVQTSEYGVVCYLFSSEAGCAAALLLEMGAKVDTWQ